MARESKPRSHAVAARPRASGRSREADKVRAADKAAAIGRLLLGQLDPEFFKVATRDYQEIPRRNLKSAVGDVTKNVHPRIARFCGQIFDGMTTAVLSRLYDAALEPVCRGEVLAIPLADFERSFAKIRGRVLRGSPRHCTVVISWRGLQFMFPEDLLAKDLIAAADILLDVAEKARFGPIGDEERWLARLQGLASSRLVKKAYGERLRRHALARSCEILQVFLGARFARSLNPSRLVGFSAAC